MNFEANNALMRALPTNSAVTASNLYHTLCSKKGRAPTFSEFTSHLNIYADSINRDIKQNGMETTQRKAPQSSKTKNRNPPNRREGQYRQMTSFAVDMQQKDMQKGQAGQQNSSHSPPYKTNNRTQKGGNRG